MSIPTETHSSAEQAPRRTLFGSERPAYRSPVRLAKIVTALLILYMVGELAISYSQVSLNAATADVVELQTQALTADFDSVDWEKMEAQEVALLERAQRAAWILIAVSALFALGIAIPLIVFWCIWTHRAARNAQSFGARLSISPGWAVGWYFIPIVQLWKPLVALSEVWANSDPSERDRDSVRPVLRAPVPTLLLVWWIVWRVGWLLSSIAEPTGSATDVTTFLPLCVDIVAIALAVRVVRALSARQEQCAGVPAARAVERAPRSPSA